MRIDHGERFVEHHDVHIVPDQVPRPIEIFCLLSGDKARGAGLEHILDFQHRGDLKPRGRSTLRLVDAPIAQRKGEVIKHGHGVVDHRELEHLGDVALGPAQDRSHPRRSKRILPSEGVRRPEMMLSSVDLPQPDGPSSA